MKNKILFLFIFLFSLFTFGIVRASILPLFGKVIYLDPGHGGPDPGAVWGNIYESQINLEISLKLQEELEKNGAIVYLTRYGDYDLSVNPYPYSEGRCFLYRAGIQAHGSGKSRSSRQRASRCRLKESGM